MFVKVVIFIAIISVLLAVWSLRGLNAKPDVKTLKKKLDKGRVIFHSSSSDSS